MGWTVDIALIVVIDKHQFGPFGVCEKALDAHCVAIVDDRRPELQRKALQISQLQ